MDPLGRLGGLGHPQTLGRRLASLIPMFLRALGRNRPKSPRNAEEHRNQGPQRPVAVSGL